MLEVFICFHSDEQAVQVLDTAERWRRTKGAYPTVIQIPQDGFEIKRRVLADKLAKADTYLIADLLCVPAMPKFIETIEKRVHDTLGLAGLSLREGAQPPYPSGIRVCRKNTVNKWPPNNTEYYDQEHADAVRDAGYRVEIWPDVTYFTLKPKKFSKPNGRIH